MPSKQYKPLLLNLLLINCACLLCACDNSVTVRQYKEIIVKQHAQPADRMRMAAQDPAMQKMLDQSIAQIQLHWTAPKGWVETKGSGMRLASFRSEERDPVQCTIISLGGSAGGVKANVSRWLRQINVKHLTDEMIDDFIHEQPTIKGLGVFQIPLLDFTLLQKGSPLSTPSMMAAIYNLQDSSVFVKMTGTISAVRYNKDKFVQLCESITDE